MAKVRFLGSIYLPLYKKVFNLNDEFVIEDERTVELLKKRKYVDVLIEEEKEAPKKSAPKKRQPKKDE